MLYSRTPLYRQPLHTDTLFDGQFNCILKFAHHLRASCSDPWFTHLRYLTQLRDDELLRSSQDLSQGYRIYYCFRHCVVQPLCQSIQSRMKRFEEETVEFKSKRRGKPVWIIILAVATFVFLVLSIVFITLFALEKSKSTETSPKSPVSGQKYCGTRACLETSLGELINI